MAKLNKTKIIELLIAKASAERAQLNALAESVASGATSSEAKQEGKYDTRALLDSYLAGAQDARVRELDAEIQVMEQFRPTESASTQSISSGALVELRDQKNRSSSWYFLLPSLGGYTVDVDGTTVKTITVATPLGENLLGLFSGDECQVGASSWFVEDIC